MSIRSHPSRPRRLSDVEDDSDSDAAGAAADALNNSAEHDVDSIIDSDSDSDTAGAAANALMDSDRESTILARAAAALNMSDNDNGDGEFGYVSLYSP